jgi:ATP-binding cassette subfamily B protein
MKILYTYIKEHKPLLFLALFLATINQCFSLCDSIIIGKLLNQCGVGVANFNHNFPDFTKAVLGWLALSLGAAMMSRIAKNFQDYFTNI